MKARSWACPLKNVAATWLLVGAVPLSGAATLLTDEVDIACRQAKPLSLECEYRTLDGAALTAAEARLGGVAIGASPVTRVPGDIGKTAILFLVDTSDPARADVIEKNRELILEMTKSGAAHHVYGLAAFDSDLEILCELDCSREAMAEAGKRLVAKGRTTELFRNVLEAVKHLGQFEAGRRLIILMSDGLAEDFAYYSRDVVDTARNDAIVIASVGYPRSVSQSTALQTLRRLSEETGGLFVEAQHENNEVPSGFFDDVLTAIDGGGRVVFDLSEYQDHGLFGDNELTLALDTAEQHFAVKIPIVIPPLKLPDTTKPTVETTPTEAMTEIPPARPFDEAPTTADSDALLAKPQPGASSLAPNETSFWYGLPAAVFAGILATALAYSLASRRRRDDHKQPHVVAPATPHAFLVSAEHEHVRHIIDHTPWRIGRGRNSDLRIDDTSVSRLHAEIRRDALGQFTLQDLESLNGVFVNGDPVEITHLDESDRVEIGDVGFVFTLHDEDYAQQEPTVLVRTITPRS